MATGITKREQFSADAISALDFFQEVSPLPPEGATVELAYPNKASLDQIIHKEARTFLHVTQSRPFMPATLTDNAFILDDNFFVLNELVRSGR